MVAERFSEPPSTRATVTFLPPSHSLAMSGADEFIQSRVAHLGVTLDPATGRPYEAACHMLMMGKICMIGAVTFFQVVLMAWRRQWRQYKKVKMTDALAIYKAPEEESPRSAEAFDWARMDLQDQEAAAAAAAAATAAKSTSPSSRDGGEQQQLFKILLAEVKDLKQPFDKKEQENRLLQRSVLGVDARDDHNHEQFRQLQLRLEEQNEKILEQDKQIEQMKTPRKNLDPIWQQFHDNHSWNMDLQNPMHNRVQEAITMHTSTPTYAIGATTNISKAIDTRIDVYTANGGIISKRNVVDGHIVGDWGARVRNRVAERNKHNKTANGQDVVNGSIGRNS